MQLSISKSRLFVLANVGVLLVTVLVAFPAIRAESASESRSTGGPLYRLAADFADFGGTETATSVVAKTDGNAADPGGRVIFKKKVRVPRGHNVLYVTLSTTGDAHDGAGSCFAATVDNAKFMPFNVGRQGAARCANGARAPGWITLLKPPAGGENANCNDGSGGPGDCHDNGIYYTWCTRIRGGSHAVTLHMATSMAGARVFIENSHFYIDSNKIRGNACTKFVPAQEGGEAADLSSNNQ